MTPSENVSDFCSVVSNSSGGNSAVNGLYAANIDSSHASSYCNLTGHRTVKNSKTLI